MTTYVLVHGTWAGSWVWQQVARLLRQAGHEVYTPSLTGIGERVHLATPETNLHTHIEDVANTLIYEDVREVVLVGWSYGGMVVTGVADRVPDRLANLVYLDAFVPNDGQSAADLLGPTDTAILMERARPQGDGWRFALAGDRPRFTPQPLQTYLQPVVTQSPEAIAIPRTFIYSTQKSPSSPLVNAGNEAIARSATAARNAGWRYHELPTGHMAMQSMPRELADLLLSVHAPQPVVR